jgi:hypothetical protein
MTLDDVSKQLTWGFSNLRVDVRANGIMMEQMRDELKAVHELVHTTAALVGATGGVGGRRYGARHPGLDRGAEIRA